MSRNFPQSRGKDRMAEARSQSEGIAGENRFMKFDSVDGPDRSVLEIDRHQTNLRKLLDQEVSNRLSPFCRRRISLAPQTSITSKLDYNTIDFDRTMFLTHP